VLELSTCFAGAEFKNSVVTSATMAIGRVHQTSDPKNDEIKKNGCYHACLAPPNYS
jgi:hypothetical protein